VAFFLRERVNGITTGALYTLVALSFTMVYKGVQAAQLRADASRWCVIFQRPEPLLIRMLGRYGS